MTAIVGIDLGTTNSLVAICDERGPRILADEQGRATVPSAVRVLADGRTIVGHAAREGRLEHPQETVESVKRLMGRSAAEVAGALRHLSYAVAEGPRGMASPSIHGRIITPQELSAEILRAMRAQAEARLGVPVTQAVVTVPAYFDDAQRQATRDAGRLAGLEVVRIVNEPTAAALAYGIGRAGRDAQTIAVYDFGGGTFDISILRVLPAAAGEGPRGADLFQVRSTAGDTQLGGDDIDRAVAELLLERIAAARGVEPAALDAPGLRHRLRVEAERAKIALSGCDEVAIELPGRGEGGDVVVLERAALDACARPFVDRTIACCRDALLAADLEPAAIDRVVLVGGSTRMPLVRSAVRTFFGREPYAALDPEQVVALGASVQAAILSGQRRDFLLLDVIPLSLGIETVGGAVAKLVMRNAAVPARARELFSTSVDGQTRVRLHVVQGERELVRDCRSLASFELAGIPPMPAGIPQIEVEFLVDANGILGVEAVERRSGKRASIQVVPTHGLSREEIDRMEQESVRHARADMHAHRVIDLAVNARLDLKWIREAIERVRDELDPATIDELERRMAELEAIAAAADRDPASIDADRFHRLKQALDEASVPVHERSIARSLRGSRPAE